MPVRYAGNDNRITYGRTPIKSLMQGETAVYGEDLAAQQLDKIFVFDDSSNTVSVTGLTEYGKTLQSIQIPSIYRGRAVTNIGGTAFKNATNITSVIIPDSVTSIGLGAFSGCSSLESMTIPFVGATKDGTSNMYFGYIFGASNGYDNDDHVPTSLKEVIITGGTSIGEGAFRGCDSLTSVTIPYSVTSIGYEVFRGCDALETLTVDKRNPVYHSAGNCVIETETGTLIQGCNNSVIPDDGSVTSIGESAFAARASLASITIPDSVTSIGDEAFAYCTSLTSVIIPDSVTSIRYSTFENCTSLTSVTIGRWVRSIEGLAFCNCTSLTSVTIPDRVTSVGARAFSDCTSLTSVTIGDGVTSIGLYAFRDCTSLTSVTFEGTMAEWDAVDKDSSWKYNCPFTRVVCSDGTVRV